MMDEIDQLKKQLRTSQIQTEGYKMGMINPADQARILVDREGTPAEVVRAARETDLNLFVDPAKLQTSEASKLTFSEYQAIRKTNPEALGL